MRRKFPLVIFTFLVILLSGCAGGSDSPLQPEAVRITADSQVERQLWGYWDIAIDPQTLAVEVTPRRDVAFHLNARKFLEETPCTHCLSLQGISPSDHGSLLVDVEIRHPFLGLTKFTGFDVRGVVIFPGSRSWPVNDVTTSSGALGDAELLNPDGLTKLFNPVDFPVGSGTMMILEYSHGNLATADPDNTLNGYKNFFTQENRRYFMPGDAEVRTYDIDFPDGPILFGYAVDASWKMPANLPPVVPDDFPISANCFEAYHISSAQLSDIEQQGSGQVRIDVYDWQGTGTIDSVSIEAPDLYDGVVTATLAEDNISWARFTAILPAENTADVGEYDCLIRVDDIYDDPNLGPVSAFGMIRVTVVEGEPPNADCEGNLFLIADGNTFTGAMGGQNSLLMANMILHNAGLGEFADADNVKFYNGHNGYFNSTLTAMQDLVGSLGFTFVQSAEEPIETANCRMIVIYEPGKSEVSLFSDEEALDLIYFLNNGGRILMVSDYTSSYYPDKTTFNDLLTKLGSTMYDDAYTNFGGINVDELADCPVMAGLSSFSMAANSRFIIGPNDMILGYSEIGGGIMLCSSKFYFS